MRLTALVIEQPPQPALTVPVSERLTILVEPNAHACLAEWLGDCWFGPRGRGARTPAAELAGSSWQGSLVVEHQGGTYQATAGQPWGKPGTLDREAWEAFACFAPAGGTPSWSRLAELLRARHTSGNAADVVTGSYGDSAGRDWSGSAVGLGQHVAALNSMQVRLHQDWAQQQRAGQARRGELENRQRQADEALDRVRGALQLAARRRDELDRRIAELEKRGGPPASAGPDAAERESWSMLLSRLEELDRHAAAWQSIQQAIQDCRMELRTRAGQAENWSIDSAEHPYHKVRSLVRGLEAELPIAAAPSSSAAGLLEPFRPEVPATLSAGVRAGLEAICNELQEQYRHVRHRTTAAELKQLRACYQALEKHGNELTRRRQQLLESLAQLDPAGAAHLARPDEAFRRELEQHGYVAARLRCGDAVPLPGQVLAVPSSIDPNLGWWNELEACRRDRARLQREIEQDEQRERSLSREREGIQAELFALPVGRDGLELQLEQLALGMHRIHCELENLHRRLAPAGPGFTPRGLVPDGTRVLAVASELFTRLTVGQALRLELSDDPAPALRVVLADGHKDWITACTPARQAQARLAFGLAVLRVVREQGGGCPGWLFDPLRTLEGAELAATVQVLWEESRHTQLILVVAQAADAQLFAAAEPTICRMPVRSQTGSAVAVPALATRPAPGETTPAQRWRLGAPRPACSGFDGGEADVGHEPIYRFPIERPGFHAATPASFPVSTAPSSSATAVLAPPVELDNPLLATGLLSSAERNALQRAGIETIRDLLQWEPDDLAHEIRELPVSAATIDRWQANCWLMVCIPGLAADDARVLSDCGILDPEQLDAMSGDHLVRRLAEQVGEVAVRERYRFDRINAWIRSLSSTRPLWQRGQGYSRLAQRQPRRKPPGHGERWKQVRHMTLLEAAEHWNEWLDSGAEEASVVRVPGPGTTGVLAVPATEERCNLQRQDSVSTVPSIGAKTAQLLGQQGVATVADLLAARPEELANRLQQRRITAEVIRHWQFQANLASSIPGLSGQAAQLLIACGVTGPQQLAEHEPSSLHRRLETVASTKEGQRLLRGAAGPDGATVARWVRAAQGTRALSAA